MFCYCRLLRRVLSHNNRGNSSYLKFSCTNYVHSESLSINRSKNVQERNPSLLAVREVRTLEFFWRKQRNGKRFKSIIDDYFLNNEGSSSHVLDLLRAACYSSHCSSGLVFSLLINLNDVINRKGEFSPSLDEKKEALQSALIYQSYDIIQEVCKAFKIEEHSHCFKEFINNLISEQKLIQACYCITALRLQDEFDIEKIFFPLLLEGKIHPLVMCIENHPDVQLRIVKKLDNLLGEENIGTINYKPSLNSRKIYKVLNKLMNILKIPSENYKYVHHIRSRGAINILIKRRSDQSVSEEAWKEMVMSIIGDEDQLKEYLIFKLMQQNDKETALEMVENLNMIDFDVTKYDLAIGEETEIDNAMDKEEFEDLSKQFEKENNSGHLMFPLSASDIKYTDNVEKFTEFIDDILKYNIAGIDTEWKPQFNLSPERLALMQIAVHDKFIF
ncbi:exonuclease mut-7 [Caerostris darwini]|uniref:Exonuclease mut-7 n=1 Tax=Caerostris darwini TaxID=1538125 RepID=A0AAV4VBK9_9ARAC|nr:exonuclease mut-7 [Caerostris darwini]